ncbi:methyltransferase family protein [Leucobacter komagatae]|uniref:Methyltransferase family protein n=1 Tax=Leucobacter komagatae TaxID=55969 RepID=A0A542Y6Y1_9MICO|nr:class I SAM-dependent methyltransferase [Leucobacter komagatae]TQL43841.1 methyltransferase family protein [Leucobacter komagatae]
MSGHEQDPVTFWEERYGGEDRVWSGKVNASLAAVVAEHVGAATSGSAGPGRSLDLGCGEGGDVLWLAERGWDAAGIDISSTAVARAQEEAQARGLQARFAAEDLAEWAVRVLAAGGGAAADQFDLVTASFLQSPVHLPRTNVLRAAALSVAPGGHLVVISHGAPPVRDGQGPVVQHGPGPDHEGHAPHSFPTPESELDDLGLGAPSWEVVVAETRIRDALTGRGERVLNSDTVIVARRLT